ncbi:MAG: serine/threonine protein kinase [Planctomycetes bacterium]|nr:serine/threonine protein kinase [Planctomycetota bacterium]
MARSPEDVTQLVVKSGFCSPEQVQEGLDILQKMRDMGINPKSLPEILLEKGYLAIDQFQQIAGPQRADKSSLDKDSIPGFELLNKIGQGGMGAVFRAKQVSMDRVVALKVLPPRLAKDAAYKERFLREARAVAKLNHENIIQGIDVGVASGLYYFVMEFVDGKPVSKTLGEAGTLPEKKALAICGQIARALEHANKHKLVHRDVKPENIMVTADGVAKLCDLGLAKQESGDAGLTQAGLSVGTPNYISPEQARGEGDVDIRSDLYSLGASLYHMLTGKVPFEGGVPSVVMTKHITEALVPPAKLRPEVTPEANAIVLKAMEKKREDRYQEPGAMAADLEAAAAGKPLVHAKVAGRKAAAPAAAPAALPTSASNPEGRKLHGASVAHYGTAPAKSPSWMIPVAVSMVAAAAILAGVFAMTQRGKKKDTAPVVARGGKTEPVDRPDFPGLENPVEPPPVNVSAEEEKKIESEFKALLGYIELHEKDPAKHPDIEERLEDFIAAHRKTDWENRAIAAQRKYREGMDATAGALLEKLKGEIAELRKAGKHWEALAAAQAKWPPHYDATPTAKKHEELLKEIEGDMQAAWIADRDAAKALLDKREYTKATSALEKVPSYASPAIQTQAQALRDEIRKAAEAYAAGLAETGRRRYDAEFYPALEKILFERRYKDALTHCGKFHTDPEMAAVRDRVAAMIEDVSSLNLILTDAGKGAEIAAKLKDPLRIKNFDVRITGRDGDRVSYAFLNGGSSELLLTRADEADLATLCRVAYDALPADQKAADRGPYAFRIGLLFFFTPDEKDRKRAAEELEKANRDGVARARHYLDRIAETSMGETEVTAKRLFEEAQEAFNAKRYGEAKQKFQRLLSELGTTAWVKERRDAIQQRIAECDAKLGGADTAGIQKVLKGQVVRTYSKGQVEVKYDFSNADQLQDWTSLEGTWTWDKETQSLRGQAAAAQTRGFAWNVPLTGDLSIEMDVTPLADKNIGIRVHSDLEGRYYMALFGGDFGDEIMQNLGNPDLKNAALVKVQLGARAPFNVLASTAEAKPVRGQPIRARLSRAGRTVVLYVGGKKVLDGQDDAFTSGQISLFLMGSEARFDDITIFGTPDEKWLKEKLGGK